MNVSDFFYAISFEVSFESTFYGAVTHIVADANT